MKKYEIEINGETYRVAVKELAADAEMATNDQPVNNAQAATPAPAPTPAAQPTPVPATTATGEEVKSPMPGTILSIEVTSGQNVAEGDVLAILEAMKMENEIIAPVAGVINEILVNPSDSVQADQVLFIL